MVSLNKIVKTFQYGAHTVTFETGQIARQATGSVIVRMGETVLLVTVVAQKEAKEGRDFFPLTVNYQEKTYAAGKIPGGYFKREGRPTEKETLTSRLIDRPLRPLFPKEFTNEVQVIATVLSMDPAVSADVPAMLGASAAIGLAGIPFNGPLGAARVGYRDGQYLLNPSLADIATSQLDLVVAGTKEAVLMVESEAHELSESIMLGAVLYGHEQMQVAIRAIEELVEEARGGGGSWEWAPPAVNNVLEQLIAEKTESRVREAYRIREKMVRQTQLQSIRDELVSAVCGESPEQEGRPTNAEVAALFHELERKIVRQQIISGEPRIDGRDTKTVRPISIEVGILPRVHGSALFTRGETQALVATTLGTERDAQRIDDLDSDRREDFMLHYNFPPFSVGEVGFMTGPKRREIGHGRLAKRAVVPMVPKLEQFPYVIRVVSEILESNGSSSMASVCGTSLSLMDAGVPVKAPVAGIAMGLIKEGDQYAILTDILGDEDHLGDMDFKVAGTANGVTALQMDIKIEGITKEIMERALDQAKEGRMHILGIMNQSLDKPREQVSELAPRLIMMKINPEKIREVIGKGGATIREITEKTHCTIDIADDGTIKIAAANIEDGERAKRRIEELTVEVELDKTYEGQVIKILDFGAVVSFLGAHQGLVHISQIAEERVENVTDYVQEGQVVRVKVIEIDRQGRVRLSMRQADK